MIKLFEFLWHGCWHKWNKPYGIPTDHYDISFGGKRYMYTTKSVACEKCGRGQEVKVAREY